MKECIEASRKYCEKMLQDPYRPTYHFAIPEDDGRPGDPNGAFFADGRYHLMYLYWNSTVEAFHWGHISSTDLLHWRRHPDALTSHNGDEGCFSGGGFVDDDGTAYLSFWKFPAKDGSDLGGIGLACARPPYDVWERMEPIAIPGAAPWGVAEIEVAGEIRYVGCADPSNIWKKDGWYYMQTGNKPVLNEHGQGDDAPREYQGDWVDLFRSKDLKSWEYVDRFYTNPQMGEDDWPDRTEDDMCPSFLPLPDKRSGGRLTETYLQLFISHNKGAQYYTGKLQGETFLPEKHARFSWKDRAFFAPEALIDDRNRQIMWGWLVDNPEGNDFERFGWSGVYGFPRVLWLEGDELKIAPAEELDRLEYNAQTFDVGVVDGKKPLAVKNGVQFRLKAEIRPGDAQKAGFSVLCSSDGREHTDIYVDRSSGKLVFDATTSGNDGWMICEEAPFELCDGETLQMDLFVDKSVVEVYVNERQAICRRVFPTDPADAVQIAAISDGADLGVVHVWEMSPTNPY